MGLVGGLADPFSGIAHDQAGKTIRWGLLGLGSFAVNFVGPTVYLKKNCSHIKRTTDEKFRYKTSFTLHWH
jgi:hypothetical protein